MYHFDLETKARFDANAKLIVREPHMLLKFVRAFIPGLDDYSDDELLDILSDAKVLNNEIYDGYKNYMTDVVLLVETQNPFILHYEIQSYFRPKEFEKRFEAYGNGVDIIFSQRSAMAFPFIVFGSFFLVLTIFRDIILAISIALTRILRQVKSLIIFLCFLESISSSVFMM